MTMRLLSAYSTVVIGVWVLLCLALVGYNSLHLSLYLASWGSLTARFILPLGAACLLLALFRLRLESRLVWANTLLAITAALYGGEIYLAYRLTADQQSAARGTGTAFDGRDKITVIKDLRAQGVAAYPIMRAKNMLAPDGEGELQPILSVDGTPVLPMASLPRTVVVSCNETGQWQVYETDRHGFNNPDAEWDAPQPAIGLIGDSFAHGSCVPPDRNIAALLRPRFGGVVNLGVGGFGPLQELAALTEYLPSLKPRIVLWAFFEGNDLTEDLPLEVKSPLLRSYLSDDGFRQNLIGRNEAIGAAMRRYLDQNMIAAMDRVDDPGENLMRYLSLDRLREAVGLGPVQLGFNPGSLPEELDLFEQVMRRAKERVGSWGGTLYLVYLPESDRYLSRLGDSVVRQGIYRGVAAISQRLDITMIDVAAVFAKDASPGRYYAYPGSHYNAEGYRVAAGAIAEVLSSEPK